MTGDASMLVSIPPNRYASRWGATQYRNGWPYAKTDDFDRGTNNAEAPLTSALMVTARRLEDRLVRQNTTYASL